MAELVEATAAQAIPYPSEERAAAVEAIANYLRILRDWTATRYAVAGDGGGVVAIANRNSYIYARLGGADGDVIEAKLINLLEPANGDALLVRREHPGGAGGWLVLDVLAEVVARRVCGNGVFWLNLDNWALFRVDTAAVSGSSGTLVNETLSDDYNLLWLASGGTNRVSVLLDDSVWSFGTSIDGGSNFDIATQGETVNYWLAYWRTMYSDLSDSNLLWAYTLGVTPAAGNNLYVSADGGATWNANTGLHVPGGGNAQAANIVAPRHNGQDAFIVTSEDSGGTPQAIYIDLVNADGTVVDSYTFTSGQLSAFVDENYGGAVKNGVPWWGCCAYGDTDNLFFLASANMGLYRFTWSTKTLTSLGNLNGEDGGNYQKELISTRAGTLLIPASPLANPGFLYVYRSTDGGATWTEIDLSAMLPSYRAADKWDYIAIANNDMLAIPIQGDASAGWDGYLIFSTDDGATWQQSDVFIPMSTYGKPIDICGEG